MSNTISAVAAATLLMSACSAMAAPSAADKCEASKSKTAGAYYSCREKAEATAITKAAAPDYSKCTAKFDDKWDDAETKGGGMCPDTVLTAPMNAFIAAQATEAAAVIAGGPIPTCAADLASCEIDVADCNVSLDNAEFYYSYVVNSGPLWFCDPLWYGGSDGCDCGCGAIDPDCASLAAASCGADICPGSVNATNNSLCTGVPAGWNCAPNYYGTADGCDCGCGVADPDCADATAASCEYCDNLGSCNVDDCPGNIDPVDNAQCQ